MAEDVVAELRDRCEKRLCGDTCLPCQAAAEIERLRASLSRAEEANAEAVRYLKTLGKAVEGMAFEMPAPNVWTPRFVALGQSAVRCAHGVCIAGDGSLEEKAKSQGVSGS